MIMIISIIITINNVNIITLIIIKIIVTITTTTTTNKHTSNLSIRSNHRTLSSDIHTRRRDGYEAVQFRLCYEIRKRKKEEVKISD